MATMRRPISMARSGLLIDPKGAREYIATEDLSFDMVEGWVEATFFVAEGLWPRLFRGQTVAVVLKAGDQAWTFAFADVRDVIAKVGVAEMGCFAQKIRIEGTPLSVIEGC